MHTKYLEDFDPGQIFRTRGMSMDESEIMDFARKYDPQPIHTDREASVEGPFEGLIASGWHTGSRSKEMLMKQRISFILGEK